MAQATQKDKKAFKKNLPFLFSVGINELAKGFMDKNDVVILITYVDGMFTMWLYPKNCNMKIVENLLTTGHVQVKQMGATLKEIEEKDRSKSYIG